MELTWSNILFGLVVGLMVGLSVGQMIQIYAAPKKVTLMNVEQRLSHYAIATVLSNFTYQFTVFVANPLNGTAVLRMVTYSCPEALDGNVTVQSRLNGVSLQPFTSVSENITVHVGVHTFRDADVYVDVVGVYEEIAST